MRYMIRPKKKRYMHNFEIYAKSSIDPNSTNIPSNTR